MYRDATTARQAFRKGLIDVFWETDIRYWSASYDIPALQLGRIHKDTRTVRRYIGAERALVFNLNRQRLRDVRVREALTLAFDFEWQNRVLQHGSQGRASSHFAGSSMAASGLPTEAENALLAPYRNQLPARVFNEPFQLPVSTGWGPHRAALQRARDLLADAGWTLVGRRLQDAEGQPFTLEITTQNPASRRLLLPYIESLGVLGIEARLRLLDDVLAVNLRRNRSFDMYLIGHEFLNPPMRQLRSHFGSATADLELGDNLAGIRDPVVDALIELAERTPSIEAAVAVCRALDRVLLWGFYYLPLNAIEQERFLYWDKFGRPDESSASFEYLTGNSVRVIDSWWLNDVKSE